MARITAQPVQVATESNDRVGVLIFVDAALAALFVMLGDVIHGPDCGRWYLEAGFGLMETKVAPFETLRDALAWVASRLPDAAGVDEAQLNKLAATIERDRASDFPV